MTSNLRLRCKGLCYNKGYGFEVMESKETPINILGFSQIDLYITAAPQRKILREYFIYDGLGMIGSIGGSLGLFIGFSFFDFASLLLDLMADKIMKKHTQPHSIHGR